MAKLNPVVHFGMPYKDRERLGTFYTKAFGWKMRKQGKEMGNYVTAATTETDRKMMVKKPGTINGGVFPEKRGWPDRYPSVAIAVDDVKEAMEKVRESWGKVLGEPVEIPGVGLDVPFKDTEGNRVSMFQVINMRQ